MCGMLGGGGITDAAGACKQNDIHPESLTHTMAQVPREACPRTCAWALVLSKLARAGDGAP